MLDGNSCREDFAAIYLYTFKYLDLILLNLIHCCPCWPSRNVKVMFCNLSGDFRSPLFFFSKLIQNYRSQTNFISQSASRPPWEVHVYLNLRTPVSVLLQTCLSLGGGGGGSVAVACGVRLLCSVLLGTVCYCPCHLWRALCP